MKLSYKLSALILPILAASGALILTLSYQMIGGILLDAAAARGSQALGEISTKAAMALALKDERQLLPLLDTAAGRARALYVMALDPEGRVVAHTNVVERGKVYSDPQTLRGLALERPVSLRGSDHDRAVLDVFVPVWIAVNEDFLLAQEKGGKKRVGTLRLGIPLDEALATRSSIVTRLGLIMVTAWTLMMIAVLIFLDRALAPLGVLTQFTAKIGRGEREQRLPKLSKDEIGQLGEAFNKMVEDLETSETERLQSQKLAAIGRLADRVVHDLRNPLAAIRNAFFYVRDSLAENGMLEKDPDLKEFLALGDKELNNAVSIIGDLLDFTKTPRIQPVPCDLTALIDAAIAGSDIPSNVQVVRQLEKGVPHVIADPDKIRRVFVNLISNAVQAMSQKGGVLEVRTRKQADASQAWVDFVDTGTGIPPQYVKKIFEPLFSTKARGAGLGLPTSSAIVKKHGGEIVVESQYKVGSRFSVRLPCVNPRETPAGPLILPPN